MVEDRVDVVESRLVQCTDCGSVHPATLSSDGDELVPDAGRACSTCRNDEFVQVVIDVE
ncbi:hypothetical protein [Halococcus saccharolyticus]|uniref:hypothetical protein n=1 Tax=Halococcus saccharolyticus TaxID=62319 RepID=UPI000B29D212|nr:hypothetical protein [Halococcus saccharolyticus]